MEEPRFSARSDDGPPLATVPKLLYRSGAFSNRRPISTNQWQSGLDESRRLEMITFRLSFSHSYLSRFLRSCGGAAVDSHERVHKAILCPKPAWDWVASKTSPRRCNRIVIAIMNPPRPPPPPLLADSSRYGSTLCR